MASRWSVGATALVIALCWTSGVFTTKLLQQNCGYKKPYLLTYLHELGVTLIAIPIACSRHFWPRCKAMGLRAMALGLLAFVANISFMVALVLTTASSAMTLEQLTPVFIAGLSFAFLKERYQACQIFWLIVAILGSILTARSDLKACHGKSCDASMPLLGDFLVVITCITAALYMVLFKMMFAKSCGTSFQMLFTYFAMKGMSVAVVGGIALTLLPDEHHGLPSDQCGWTYLSINMIANMSFNISLAWGLLVVSPLACRLFVLLGLPASLVLDSFLGTSIVFQRILGVALVTSGVAGFEFFSKSETTSQSESETTEATTDEELSVICDTHGSQVSTASESLKQMGGASALCSLLALTICAAGFALSAMPWQRGIIQRFTLMMAAMRRKSAGKRKRKPRGVWNILVGLWADLPQSLLISETLGHHAFWKAVTLIIEWFFCYASGPAI